MKLASKLCIELVDVLEEASARTTMSGSGTEYSKMGDRVSKYMPPLTALDNRGTGVATKTPMFPVIALNRRGTGVETAKETAAKVPEVIAGKAGTTTVKESAVGTLDERDWMVVQRRRKARQVLRKGSMSDTIILRLSPTSAKLTGRIVIVAVSALKIVEA